MFCVFLALSIFLFIRIFRMLNNCVTVFYAIIYSTAKETPESITLRFIKKMKYVEFKKYILHVKLTVYYTVSLHVAYFS